MGRKLLKLFGFCIFTALIFSSCRSESDFIENTTNKEQAVQKFYIFQEKYAENRFSKNSEGFDYGNTFAYMAQRFDSINKTNITGLINTENKVDFDNAKKQYFIVQNNVPYIEFRLHSQPFKYNNEDLIMMYPKINQGKVVDLVVAALTENETQLYFKAIDKNSSLYLNNILAFQLAYSNNFSKNKNIFSKSGTCASGSTEDSSGECHIQDVIIIFPHGNGNGYSGDGGGGGKEGDGGNCGGYHMCKPPDGEGGGEYHDPEEQKDPCTKAKDGATKATTTSKTSAFSTAKTNITDMNNGKENGVVLGNVGGETKSTSVQTGGTSSGTLTHTFSDPIADLHNHLGNNPPSPGDFYVLINNQEQFTNYSTRYVMTLNGTTYALIVTDKNAMNIFIQNYPPTITSNPNGGNFVNFPQPLFNEWDDISFYNNDNQEMALSVILDKYNSGISLTKMDKNGNFKKVNYTSNTNSDGTTTYQNTPCPN